LEDSPATGSSVLGAVLPPSAPIFEVSPQPSGRADLARDLILAASGYYVLKQLAADAPAVSANLPTMVTPALQGIAPQALTAVAG
jgi:hypothetical protein